MAQSIISQSKREEILRAISNRIEELTEAIESAINSTAENTRKSTVNLIIPIAHDKDDPLNIVIGSQIKRKNPRTDYSDLTSWDDIVTLATVRLGEEPGQQKIGEN